ncbi:MAG TPA: substrate-binding domain-containing protein [Candidatus Baltobacteraceae bacterium]|nr:substrate-binding domain-containing protein [Candidatus Baltobacteraceae bacterium]
MGFLARFVCLVAAAAIFNSFALAAPAVADTTIRIGGSTNDTPALKQIAAIYHSANPGTSFSVAGSSSGQGIAALKAGTLDIACSDVAIDDPAFDDATIGVVGFVFVVGKGAGVKNLTRQDVIGIYSGKITNWKQIGGNDLSVVPFSRPIGAGTRFVFEMTVAKTLIPMTVEPDAIAVVNAVATTPGGIGYSSTNYVGDHQDLVVDYEGVAPTDQNILDHIYKFSTDEHAYTFKGADPAVKAFLAFTTTQRQILKSYGILVSALTPLRAHAAFSSGEHLHVRRLLAALTGDQAGLTRFNVSNPVKLGVNKGASL